MLLPALSKARNKAKSISCISNQKQYALAFLLYANDYNNFIMVEASTPNGSTNFYTAKAILCTNQFYKTQMAEDCKPKVTLGYMEEKLFNCPAAMFLDSHHNWSYASPHSCLVDPAHPQNYCGLKDALVIAPNKDAFLLFDGSALSPSRCFVAIDSCFGDNASGPKSYGITNNYLIETYRVLPSGSTAAEQACARHENKINMAFWDGHAESMDPAQGADILSKFCRASTTYINVARVLVPFSTPDYDTLN